MKFHSIGLAIKTWIVSVLKEENGEQVGWKVSQQLWLLAPVWKWTEMSLLNLSKQNEIKHSNCITETSCMQADAYLEQRQWESYSSRRIKQSQLKRPIHPYAMKEHHNIMHAMVISS
jgi:hypothetical protein